MFLGLFGHKTREAAENRWNVLGNQNRYSLDNY